MREDVQAFVRFAKNNPCLHMKDLCKIFYCVSCDPKKFNPLKLFVFDETYKGVHVYRVFYRGKNLGQFYDLDAVIQQLYV